MIALRSFLPFALQLIWASTHTTTTTAFSFSNWLASDYQTGFGVAFSFGNSSIPDGTCAAELETIRQMIYPAYATELTIETDWTPLDVVTTDPTLTSLFDLNPNVRRLGQKKEAKQRKLLNCAIYSCAYVNSRPQLRVIVGCLDTCQSRRELAIGNENHNDRENENRERELQTLEYGSRTSYLNGFGDITAVSFYMYAEASIEGPCRDIILDMRYVLIPLTME
jgi:hypothetical protein